MAEVAPSVTKHFYIVWHKYIVDFAHSNSAICLTVIFLSTIFESNENFITSLQQPISNQPLEMIVWLDNCRAEVMF